MHKNIQVFHTLFAKRICLLFSLLISLNLTGFAQHKSSLKGSFTNADGEALIGVNLLLSKDGFQQGTVTRLDGSYQITKLPKGTYTLQASYIGYKPFSQTVHIGGDTQLGKLQLEKESVALDDIQVIEKSTTTRIGEQAYAVQAISVKGLENTATDAKAILNRVSGVRIAQDGGVGSNSTFSLNGFSGSQVKFFLDGIPMDNFGSSLGLGDLPVNMIKHVEIYKGVVPIWLGNDALGGAVNIRTKQEANYLDVSYAYGSFNTHRASINGALTRENGFTLRGNLFYNYSDNDYKVYVINGNGDNEKQWYSRFHDAYESATAKVELGFVNKEFADQLLLGIIATGNHKEEQTGATMAKVYGGVLSESQSLIGTFKYRKEDLFIEGLDLRLYGAYTKNESHAIDTLRGYSYDWTGEASIANGSNNGEIDDRTFTIFKVDELSNQFNLSYERKQHMLALNYALSYYHRTVSDSLNPEEENNFFPKDMQKHTLGFSYKYAVAERWSTTAFAKYYAFHAQTSKLYDQYLSTERTESLVNTQSTLGYGLAASYFILPQLQTKLSYEHAYRMPSPLEMFGDGLFINPNADLRPESSDNLNLNVDYKQTLGSQHHLSAGAGFLYRNAKDLIYASVSPGSPESSFTNSLKIRFLGAEGNIQYQYKNSFHSGINATYQSITDRAKEKLIQSAAGDYWQTNFQYGFRLPNRPYFFGNANAGFNFTDVIRENTSLSLDYFLHFSEKYFLTWTELGTNNDEYIIPQQWSHDLQLSYSFQNGKYNISAMCTNIFDALLYDKFYLQKPGRAFNIKLRLSL